MVHRRKEKNFVSMFDDRTGMYVRSGIMKNGKDTGRDPFMASFPELLDVGIMGHCKHGKSGLCVKAGIECYQDGLHSEKPDMVLEDFKTIISQCKGNTYQIALGGCGDPDEHADFENILKECRNAGIVPNFTTSGLGMTEEKAAICSKYCGAVAVSWYRSEYTLRAIDMLISAGIKTNIHYVIANNTIDEAVRLLKTNRFPKNINSVVFLLHKPVGLGSKKNVVKADNPKFREFIKLVDTNKFPFKIGFDSCTVPALVSMTENTDLDSLDTCEGARWSAYISADMKMMPCSFDNQKEEWAVSLRNHTIQEVWNSFPFEDFRNHFRNACPECKNRSLCFGGCPICPEIVSCKK